MSRLVWMWARVKTFTLHVARSRNLSHFRQSGSAAVVFPWGSISLILVPYEGIGSPGFRSSPWNCFPWKNPVPTQLQRKQPVSCHWLFGLILLIWTYCVFLFVAQMIQSCNWLERQMHVPKQAVAESQTCSADTQWSLINNRHLVLVLDGHVWRENRH